MLPGPGCRFLLCATCRACTVQTAKTMLSGVSGVAQYADRLPIGLEKVIREVPADVVKAFYERWYRPQNMAVIAAGDFDADAVVRMLTEKMQRCRSRDESPALPVPRCGAGSPPYACRGSALWESSAALLQTRILLSQHDLIDHYRPHDLTSCCMPCLLRAGDQAAPSAGIPGL